MNKAVFWDRDGVLNEVKIIDGLPHPPDCLEHLQLKFGIRQLMDKICKMGYLNICVTNQPDFSRGNTTKENIEKINQAILDYLPLDDLFVCYHDYKDNCFCRKPKHGLLIIASEKYNIDFYRSWMVGDRTKDMMAGRSAGCKTIFLDCNYSEPNFGIYNDYIIKDIKEIEEIIYNG